ncbi:MAG: hypothetical protein K2I22_06495 [Lachnospiraceae bacterium]|nr:hypothetical protein [Lachnospiraceae bacterium]
MREQRREANKEELEANLKQQRYWQEMRLKEMQKCDEDQQSTEKSQLDKEKEKEQEKKEKRKNYIATASIIAILIIYVLLPIFGSGEQSAAWNWLNKVQQFVHELSSGTSYQNTKKADLSDTVSNLALEIYSKTQSALRVGNISKYVTQKTVNGKSNILYSEGKGSFASSMAQYTIFFIALAGMLYVGVILLYRLVIQCIESISSKENKNGLSDFFNEYSTPVSVLIVATSMLSTFAGRTGAWTFDKLPELFQNMVSIVLCIILVLITVDAVRLILKQCVEKGSLLRTSMHITFALLIDCVMGIVVGVLAELNIRGLLSSLFAFFLQGNHTPIYDKAEEALNGALDGEMKMICHDRKMLQGAYILRKWKKTKRKQRNNKWQSAFQHFYSRNKGRRS